MKQPGDIHIAETSALSGVYQICVAAQLFFRYAAIQVADSNIRYKFIELSALHGNTAQQLPAEPVNHAQSHQISNELTAVQYWYKQHSSAVQNQPPTQSMLNELVTLLPRQLAALKLLTHNVTDQSTKAALANLSAALQMANDQILPLLKVLPAGQQKIHKIDQ